MKIRFVQNSPMQKLNVRKKDAPKLSELRLNRKYRLKIDYFYQRMILINQVFARTLTIFDFRYRIISVKLLMFGVKMLT